MLTRTNEPDNGVVITLARVHDVEAHAPVIPAGQLVRIVGLAVDEIGEPVLWAIWWRGQEYFCLSEELRPALPHEVTMLQESC